MIVHLSIRGTDITVPIEPFVSIGTPILVVFIGGCFTLAGFWLKPKFERLYAQGQNNEPEKVDGLDPIDWLVREVGGIRGDLRSTNGRLDRLTNRFNDHIDPH